MDRLFRFLRADEIDCRIGTIKSSGLSLLLYKDARCDMNILDETFGAFGWQRHHSRDNANCIVSVYDERKGEWVEKEDTGTESNTEAEKGLASDSFKRACFNWGIGRELYTAPFIWIPKELCNIKENAGRSSCFDKFRVVNIGYDNNGVINTLEITNDTKGVDVFQYPKAQPYIARDDRQQQKVSEHPAPKKESSESILVRKDEEGEYVECADCGEKIRDQKKKGGTTMSVRDYVDACMRVYGRPVCKGCRKSNDQGETG